MTAPASSRDRAAEIIAAYGGDPARWPDAERAAALAAVAADRDLIAVQAAAAALDHDLAAWACAPVAVGDTAALAVRAMRKPPALLWRWAAAGSIAASVAAAAVLLTPATLPAPAAIAIEVSDEAAFASLFTTTPDEESYI